LISQSIIGRARAWRCRTCTRLTIRLPREPDPPHCDVCAGEVDPIELRHGKPYLNPWERP